MIRFPCLEVEDLGLLDRLFVVVYAHPILLAKSCHLLSKSVANQVDALSILCLRKSTTLRVLTQIFQSPLWHD